MSNQIPWMSLPHVPEYGSEAVPEKITFPES